MKKSNEKYRKSAYSYWLFLIFIIILVLLIKENPSNIYTYLFKVPFLVFIISFFYKLTIVINEKEIMAFFGLGLLKRKMNISEMNPFSIKQIKPKWYYGIGIRYTNFGWLYNIKFGKAIIIKSKNNDNKFIVGTDEFETIKKILLREINSK